MSRFLYFFACFEYRYEGDLEKYKGDCILKIRKRSDMSLETLRNQVSGTISEESGKVPYDVIFITLTPIDKGVYDMLSPKNEED